MLWISIALLMLSISIGLSSALSSCYSCEEEGPCSKPEAKATCPNKAGNSLCFLIYLSPGTKPVFRNCANSKFIDKMGLGGSGSGSVCKDLSGQKIISAFEWAQGRGNDGRSLTEQEDEQTQKSGQEMQEQFKDTKIFEDIESGGGGKALYKVDGTYKVCTCSKGDDCNVEIKEPPPEARDSGSGNILSKTVTTTTRAKVAERNGEEKEAAGGDGAVHSLSKVVFGLGIILSIWMACQLNGFRLS